METSGKLSVFLCHSSADKPAVRELYKRLISQGWIEPWLDSEKLLPGQDWNTEIEKALERAHAVVVTISKGSVNKEGYLQREFKYALDIALEKPEGSIFIIPLRLEEIDKQELPRSLKSLQYVDYFPKSKRLSAFERILESLRERAAMLGITQNIKSSSEETRTRIETKKKSSNFNIHAPKIITSNAEFPIREIPFSQNRNFSGRQNVIDLIRDDFTKPQSSIPIYAITGLGGIGKTQIAIYYSYAYAQEYDLIWWIRSETDASLSADYQSLSNALLLPVKTKAEQIVFINIVNNYLENTDRKWLLIFDNVESREKIESILAKKGNGHILITSQSREWRQIASDAHLIPFTDEDGREFLSRRINEKNAEKADKLTRLLGGLPLAMEQACAYMDKRGTPIDSYIKLFEAQQQELWSKLSAPKDYHSTLTTTWAMAFKQIRQTQPVAEELLNIFSFFAPDGIPFSIFKSQTDLLPEKMRNVVINPIELEDCLAALYSYSLIERDGDFISIHRLVQDVVRSRLSSDDLRKYLSLALEIMKKTFPFDEDAIDSWSISAQLLPHTVAVSDHSEKFGISLESTSDVYQKVGEYFAHQGEYIIAKEFFQKAVNIRRQVLGERSDKLAESLNCLGEICAVQANYDDALNLYQQASNIFGLSGNSHNRISLCNQNNFGRIYATKGDLESARKYFEETLESRRNIFGENHPDTADSLNDLGVLYAEQGDFEVSLKYHEEALNIQRSALGENHPDVALSLGNLGGVYYERRDFQIALKLEMDSLHIRRRVLGENHSDTAHALSGIGMILVDLGNFDDAKKYLEEALNIRKTIYGEDHPEVGNSLGGIGYMLVRQARYVEARHFLDPAVLMLEKAYGSEHHHLVRVLSHLSTALFHLRLFPQARSYASRAIKICREAKVKYKECEEIKKLHKLIPLIGKKGGVKSIV